MISLALSKFAVEINLAQRVNFKAYLELFIYVKKWQRSYNSDLE